MEFLKRTNSMKKQICVPYFSLIGFPCAAEDLAAEEGGGYGLYSSS
ncbi:hypothetical protein NC652_031530 [Populus alba x Populus x berolinensis]|uniref:Uncharacterized protein n=1 Tax=Populus alba x Populus x berolinensis TaxID=444605 RepID=A0AAD6Q1H0_9ROSI|nr:hypothetical protein NC652_031530 [Populus alba x Populus x berolinensis]KAJ6975456.1 hypothetical protein NC653_031335 [Populus alba x Populus x berolinensis]